MKACQLKLGDPSPLSIVHNHHPILTTHLGIIGEFLTIRGLTCKCMCMPCMAWRSSMHPCHAPQKISRPCQQRQEAIRPARPNKYLPAPRAPTRLPTPLTDARALTFLSPRVSGSVAPRGASTFGRGVK